MRVWRSLMAVWAVLFLCGAAMAQEKNLVDNPSFEGNSKADPKGPPFAKWISRVWDGQCELQVGNVGHSGKHSALLIGRTATKVRIWQQRELEPGRYRTTAYIRGFDIGLGLWKSTTEFMFNEQYINLNKNGTFGWTKLTFVGDVKAKKMVMGPSFGTFAPGYLWIDDVTLEKVGDDVPLTLKKNDNGEMVPFPVFDKEEAPLAPPGKLDGTAIRCPECKARNMAAWKTCYVCGTDLSTKKAVVKKEFTGPPVKVIANFEDKSPFCVLDSTTPAPVVDLPGAKGVKAMKLEKLYDVWIADQDWSGYDFLKYDVYTDAKEGMAINIEFYDVATSDYWTRGMFDTVIAQGHNTVTVPISKLAVGEKSAQGQLLNIAAIKKWAFIIDEKPAAPVLISNIRLERAKIKEDTQFAGLYAFDFQSDGSTPVMTGFTPIFPTSVYSEMKGYGLKDAKTGSQEGQKALEPDSLYEDYFFINSGEFLIDVPNGKYRVFLNVNAPAMFWGNRQEYTKRTITAQGKTVVDEVYDEAAKKKSFFKNYAKDDLPTENAFDKYEKSYDEKVFDVEVTDGQLRLGFQGDGAANAVSALIVFPLDKLKEGEKFLKSVVEDRRDEFDMVGKRRLHTAVGDGLAPSDADKKRGYVTFVRDVMKEVYYNDTPFKSELGRPVAASAFAGEMAPMTLAISPLQDLGKVTVTAGDLTGPGGTIPVSAVNVGYVSYRLSRVTMGGSVYTILPRYVMPTDTVDMPKDIARRFWMNVTIGADAKPGVYKGTLKITPEKGGVSEVPVELRVLNGTLDELDIPAGPWGYEVPFMDPMVCLKKMREYGFNYFSSGVVLWYCGFDKDKNVNLGVPWTDRANKLMTNAKEMGFKAVMYYGSMVGGYNVYQMDNAAMTTAGYKDYSEFIKAVYTGVDKLAKDNNWIPYYVNLCDEPRDAGLTAAVANAEAYRKAFPKGPPLFTGATSVYDVEKDKEHLRLAKALHVANLNMHNEDVVKAIHDAGGEWSFYNGGNRWTYGDYMYKAAKQFGMKFRISWHWNLTSGDPYYALDCREDEFCWANASPDGKIVPSVEFEQQREGLGDYRRLLTLARLAKEKAGTPAAQAAEKLIADRMGSFKLGQREHDELFGVDDWETSRTKINDAIEALRK